MAQIAKTNTRRFRTGGKKRICPFCGRIFSSSSYITFGQFKQAYKSHVIRCPGNPDRIEDYRSDVYRERAITLAHLIYENNWSFFKAKYLLDLPGFDSRRRSCIARFGNAIKFLKEEGVLVRFNSCIWRVNREQLEMFLEKNGKTLRDFNMIKV